MGAWKHEIREDDVGAFSGVGERKGKATGKCRNSPARIMQQETASRSGDEENCKEVLRKCGFCSNHR